MDIITIDFETYWDKDYSLSRMTTEQYIRDPRFEAILMSYKINKEPVKWVAGSDIRAFLESIPFDQYGLLCHNAQFDGAILAWKYGMVPKYYFDTMNMAKPKHQTDVGGSLKALAQHYGLQAKGDEVTRTQGKRLVDFTDSQLEVFAEYCMRDTQITYDLFHKLIVDFPKPELFIIDMMLRMFTCPALELDKELLTEYLHNIREKKQLLIERVGGVEAAQLMSQKQFAELLRKLGVEPPTKISPRTGKPTFAMAKNDPEFKELLEHPDKRVQTLMAARLGVKNTQEETRTEHFLQIAQRGKLPIPLRYYGGHTGRASGDGNINLQNLQRGGTLRKTITAPEGHVLVACDSSQIEARVLAWLSGQIELVIAFEKGTDVYSEFASGVYDTEVTKETHPTERHVGKTAILGLGYGMGADKFQLSLKTGKPPVDLPHDRCKYIVEHYRRTHYMIPDLWRRADIALKAMLQGKEYDLGDYGVPLICADNAIKLPNGMYLRYPHLDHSATGYTYKNRYGQTYIYGGKLVENVVQALARIIVFTQMAQIEQELRRVNESQGGGVHRQVVLTVHDEVVAVVPEDEGAKWLTYMEQVMATPPRWAATCPIACEGGIGKTYGDAK